MRNSFTKIRRRLTDTRHLAFFCVDPEAPTPTISRVKCFLWDFLLSAFHVYSHRQRFCSAKLRPSRFHLRRLEFTALPPFRLRQPSLSSTLRVPEAASKELSYPRAAHTDFPPSSPFPSTIVTPLFLYLCLCLLSTPRVHAVTRSHAANTCSCLPLRSYGPGDDATRSTTSPGLITNIDIYNTNLA